MGKRSKARSRSPPPDPAESSESDDTLSTISSRPSSASSQRMSTSKICNLIFPVPRVKAMLKVNNHANRVSNSAAVFLTSVLEYVTTEILELSVNAAISDGTQRINPKHIHVAIKTDKEFFKNFKNSSVASGGFVPFHRQVNLLPGAVPMGVALPIPSPASAKKPRSSKKSKRKVSRKRGQ